MKRYRFSRKTDASVESGWQGCVFSLMAGNQLFINSTNTSIILLTECNFLIMKLIVLFWGRTSIWLFPSTWIHSLLTRTALFVHLQSMGLSQCFQICLDSALNRKRTVIAHLEAAAVKRICWAFMLLHSTSSNTYDHSHKRLLQQPLLKSILAIVLTVNSSTASIIFGGKRDERQRMRGRPEGVYSLEVFFCHASQSSGIVCLLFICIYWLYVPSHWVNNL